MKFIHTSDIHLDSPLGTHLDTAHARDRRRELLHSFSRLVDCAITEGVQGVIIAGDLFDSGKVSRRALDTALGVIEAAKKITFFYLPGNHEGEAIVHSGRAIPKNLLIFGDEWTYFQCGEVTICGRSTVSEDMFHTLTLPEHTKNIVVLHGELRDRTYSPETVGRQDARGRNIDYLALGHYHSYSYEQIDKRCVAVYSGTPEGRGFDETGDKGYVMLDTSDVGVKFSFIPFAKRRLHIAEVDITGATRVSEIERLVAARIMRIPRSDLVRVLLVGEHKPELWTDTDALTEKLGGNYYYFEVRDESHLSINRKEYANDKSLKGEFIRLVMADETLSERDKEDVIATGLYALLGEEYYER